MQCKIKVNRHICGLFTEYQPELGKVYDAEYTRIGRDKKELAIIDILDKKICLREGEFEIVED